MRPNFGAEWAGSGHTLSTLRPGSRLPGRKTRFRLLAKLYRVGSLAHWVPPKGFFDASYIAFLLSQAFPGASALRSHRPPALAATRSLRHLPESVRRLTGGLASPARSSTPDARWSGGRVTGGSREAVWGDTKRGDALSA